ncbi:MAG: hypothetical protein R3Y13_05065 [bacterium]
MKGYLYAVISAIIVGGGFAIFIFCTSSTDNDAITVLAGSSEKVYLFQLGVFSSEDNAIAMQEKSTSAIIDQINDYYYVYGAIYSDIYLVSILKDYYDSIGVNYQIKDIIVDYSFYKELTSYETLLIESSNLEVILRTNQIILDKYAILKE